MINLCVYISFTNNHSNVNHFSADPDTNRFNVFYEQVKL